MANTHQELIDCKADFPGLGVFIHEFWLFGLKQARACVFGGFLLAVMLVSRFWYPLSIAKYDFYLVAAVAFQIFLLACRLETLKESLIVVVFHLLAMAMEIFKTSDAIGSWSYPGQFSLGIGHVPLFAGFMYSAVGSFIARVWRIFDFRFTHYPRQWKTGLLVMLVYANFFSHHFLPDFRYLLLGASIVLFARTRIYFCIDKKHRWMPLTVGWLLVALFIWFAENIATYSNVWLYPTQKIGWHMVSMQKLFAWYLLMLLSFVLVSLVHRPKAWPRE